MAYEHIEYEVDHQVATIYLNRPERLNALSPTMRTELVQAMKASNVDDDIRVIVITGKGRGFCSGGDVKAMNESSRSGDGNPLEEKIAPVRDQVLLAIHNADKPVIAAVNGVAVGAGMNLALACDIRIASDTAKFSQAFVKRGLHPDWGGTYFLPRIVGLAKACQMTWSGEIVDAEEARSLGIVTEVTASENLLPRTMEMAASFARNAPIAIRLSRKSMYRNMNASLQEALDTETAAQNLCSQTEDFREGVAAFVEKREPSFNGR
jgi:2-(1,2-epoxy-1,2-dihydrophenyl)acetyl-CoA isomerase